MTTDDSVYGRMHSYVGKTQQMYRKLDVVYGIPHRKIGTCRQYHAMRLGHNTVARVRIWIQIHGYKVVRWDGCFLYLNQDGVYYKVPYGSWLVIEEHGLAQAYLDDDFASKFTKWPGWIQARIDAGAENGGPDAGLPS